MNDKLFLLDQGIGNVMQTVPLYLSLKAAGIDMDVGYIRQYPTDSVRKTECFPADNIREFVPQQQQALQDQYKYIIQAPYVTKQRKGKEHFYLYENMIKFYELDSEVKRNMNVCEVFDVEKKMLKEVEYEESPFHGDIVIHNGALKGWERKQYPYFDKVIDVLINVFKMKVASIGAPEEWIPGTIDATGTNLRLSAGIILNHKIYIGTDTGTYHIAACADKKGLVLFTATDPRKNWDKEFHHTVTKLHTYIPCQPCQWTYHYSAQWGECNKWNCQSIRPDHILEYVDLALKGIL